MDIPPTVERQSLMLDLRVTFNGRRSNVNSCFRGPTIGGQTSTVIFGGVDSWRADSRESLPSVDGCFRKLRVDHNGRELLESSYNARTFGTTVDENYSDGRECRPSPIDLWKVGVKHARMATIIFCTLRTAYRSPYWTQTAKISNQAQTSDRRPKIRPRDIRSCTHTREIQSQLSRNWKFLERRGYSRKRFEALPILTVSSKYFEAHRIAFECSSRSRQLIL